MSQDHSLCPWLSAGDVIVFGAAANIVAGFATMLFGVLDDRLGPKRVILISLGALVTLGILIFILHEGGPGTFWVLGLLMTVFTITFAALSLPAQLPDPNRSEVTGPDRWIASADSPGPIRRRTLRHPLPHSKRM